MLSFFPGGVLDEILNLIESISEDFPSYSFILRNFADMCTMSLVFADVLQWQSERLTKYKYKTRIINNFTSLHII